MSFPSHESQATNMNVTDLFALHELEQTLARAIATEADGIDDAAESADESAHRAVRAHAAADEAARQLKSVRATGEASLILVAEQRYDEAKAANEAAQREHEHAARELAERQAANEGAKAAVLAARSALDGWKRARWESAIAKVESATAALAELRAAHDAATEARDAAARSAEAAQSVTTATAESLAALTGARREAQRQADACEAAESLLGAATTRVTDAQAQYDATAAADLAPAMTREAFMEAVAGDLARLACLEVEQHRIAAGVKAFADRWTAVASEHAAVAPVLQPRKGTNGFPLLITTATVAAELHARSLVVAMAAAEAVREEEGTPDAHLDARVPGQVTHRDPYTLRALAFCEADGYSPLAPDAALLAAVRGTKLAARRTTTRKLTHASAMGEE